MLFQHYFEDESLPYEGVRVSPGRTVPLISSYAAGSLGAIHLPRMWLKGLLYAVDALAEGYGFGPGGLDRRLTRNLGIDPASFITYLTRSFPSYGDCESWVREHAENLTEGLSAANDEISRTPLRGNLSERFRRYFGIDDLTLPGIMLNNVDDWWTVHALVAENPPGSVAPIIPAVGSIVTGPSGIMHLPRFWLTATLAARSALAGDATQLIELDRLTAHNLGFHRAAATAFIKSDLPSYVRFEAWVRENSERMNAKAIAFHNESIRSARGPDGTIADNDLRDWDALHAQINERRTRSRLPLRTPPLNADEYRPGAYR